MQLGFAQTAMAHDSTAGSSSSAYHDYSQPPVPFADFQFSFDPSVYLPHEALSMPPSSDLFSPSETTNLFGFLDNFNLDLDVDAFIPEDSYQHFLPNASHLSTTTSSGGPTPADYPTDANHLSTSQKRKSRSPSSSKSPPDNTDGLHNSSRAVKPLLSTPQKRMNHIMSEQKRRNAIREGYAQLTTLLAPPGAAPGEGMPTRGRPKGSGTRGKGQACKGKSGVLLRAVEYCRWLEEGRNALLEEVKRVEVAAGIQIAA